MAADQQHRPEQHKQSPAEEQRELSAWHRLTSVGIEFIVAIGIFGAIGWFADSRLGTKPWLMIVGFGIGFAIGLYLMVRQANRMFRD
jgi:ATP synthase protein I